MWMVVTLDVDAVDVYDDIFEGDRFEGHDLLDEHIAHRLLRSSGQSEYKRQISNIRYIYTYTLIPTRSADIKL